MKRMRTDRLTRREALFGLGASIAAIPLAHLLGCESGADSMGDDVDDLIDERTGPNDGGSDASASSDGSTTADASTMSDASTMTGWATGGTVAMVAKAAYPDPFASASATSCEITCEATIGPCHTSSPERSDVSDGWDGLPMRMAVRLVDQDCRPVEGALVEIWHTNYKGVYSGRISQICNEAEADRAAGYFRGYQRSDADGKVFFDSTFPGWYAGRAVHVHLRVLKGDYDGSDGAEAWVVTQLLWDDALVKSVFGSATLYKDFGTPDTLLSADNVIGGASDKTPYVWDVQKMSDGAMLVSKTLILRSSLDEQSCSIAGGAGGRPPR